MREFHIRDRQVDLDHKLIEKEEQITYEGIRAIIIERLKQVIKTKKSQLLDLHGKIDWF